MTFEERERNEAGLATTAAWLGFNRCSPAGTECGAVAGRTTDFAKR